MSPEDRAQLHDLVAAYARSVDRRDYEELASLFLEGASFVVREGADPSAPPTRSMVGGEDIAARIAERHARFRATFHILGQQVVDIDGQTATAETYCVAHHLYEREGGTYDHVMHVRYEDVLQRVVGTWRFSERRVHVAWTDDRPVLPPHGSFG